MMTPLRFRLSFYAAGMSLLTVLSLGGCATPYGGMTVSETPVPVNAAPPQPIPMQTASTDDMSLWSEDMGFGDLFSDPKARRAGDVITIQVAESSSASNSADTSTDRGSSLSAGINDFFGVNTSTLQNLSVSGEMESGFEGSGSTSRSGRLNAYITARVVEVLPNRNLKIIGSREIMVNNEKQIMTIYGVVRPRDISDDNVVLSNYVADARIAYSGAGIVDDRQRPGWVANALNTVWPF